MCYADRLRDQRSTSPHLSPWRIDLICKICREDLPPSHYKEAEYHKARASRAFVTARCITCRKKFYRNSKGARAFRKQAIEQLKANFPSYLIPTEAAFAEVEMKKDAQRSAAQSWAMLTPEQKRVSRIERRTETEKWLEPHLRLLMPDLEIEYPINKFFADFACPRLDLVIEVDGPIHRMRQSYDFQREREIRDAGWEIVRFSHKTLEDLPTALKQLRPWLLTRSTFAS